MILNKILNIGAMLVVPSLGFFASCSNEDNVASSFSETNSGTPIAEWVASHIPDQIKDDSHVGLCKSQAESTVDEGVTDSIHYVATCVSVLGFSMKTRVQVVDGKGNPIEGVTVSKSYCSSGNRSCQHITDKDGYAYIGEELYLTVSGSKSDYRYNYESLKLRVFSADSSLGAYVYSDFSEATLVPVDSESVLELKKIVADPLYSVKVYLDSLYTENGETVLDREYLCHEDWTEVMWKTLGGESIDISRTDVEDPSLYDYLRYEITQESCKNGYVVLYALPEGTYQIDLGSAWGTYHPSVVVKP